MTVRLISDENISWRLKRLIPQWEILPANEIQSGKRLTDTTIWKFAKINQYAVLTFDEDFSEIQNLLGFPPKIIWLRTGNVTTSEISAMLIELEVEIIKFLNDDSLGIYEIYV